MMFSTLALKTKVFPMLNNQIFKQAEVLDSSTNVASTNLAFANTYSFTNFPSSSLEFVQSYIMEHPTLVVGVITYVFALLILSTLESIVHNLDLGSTFPRRILGPNEFSRKQKKLKFVTPLTMNSNCKFPTLQELSEKPRIVGKHFDLNVLQFISTDDKFNIYIQGIQEKSEEWSKKYDCDVFIIKKKMSI